MRVADFINWEVMLDEHKTPRYAGSHIEQMKNFLVDSEMIASECDNSYQGHDSMVYLFTTSDPKFEPKLIIVTDYFGSCNGCDAWEGVNDNDLREMLVAIANNARVFNSFEEIIKFFDEIIFNVESEDPFGEFYDLHDHVYSLRKQTKKAEENLGRGATND